MHHLSIDIETYSSEPIAKSGLYRYAESPDFEILLFAYSWDGAPVEIVDLTAASGQMPEWVLGALLDANTVKHAYNAAFEWFCLSRFFGVSLPLEQWHCTMMHGLYCGYTAGLGPTGKALGLPEDKQKDRNGKALIRYFCIPCEPTKTNGGRTRNRPQHAPDKWELFKSYCCQDVVTEMEIARRLSLWPVPDEVQRQWVMDQTINARGVAVDLDMIDGALEIDARQTGDMMDEARLLTGLTNPNSREQLLTWLQGQGTQIADLRKQTIEDALEDSDLMPNVRRVLEIRQGTSKTSTKKFVAMRAAVGGDGRVRGLLQFYGANRTGRWAGRIVQVQNLPRT